MRPIPSSSPFEWLAERRAERRSSLLLVRAGHVLLLALLAGATTGCGPRAAAFPTSSAREAPTTPRLPDGVLAVRITGPLSGAISALSADGDVALVPPLALEAARDVVEQYLSAHVEEDFDRLRELVSPDATTFNPTVGRGGSISLLSAFRERVRRLDYRKLEGLPLAVKAEMEVYTLDDIGRLPPGRPEAPPEMARGDAVVRARIATPRLGPDRYFGDYVEVHLRSTASSWIVVAVREEMPLP